MLYNLFIILGHCDDGFWNLYLILYLFVHTYRRIQMLIEEVLKLIVIQGFSICFQPVAEECLQLVLLIE